MTWQLHLVWAAVALLALGGGIAYERHEGAQSCVRRDVEAATKQEAKNAAEKSAAQTEIDREAKDVQQADAEPVSAPAVFVCPAAKPPRTRTVLPAPAASAKPDAAPAVPDAARPDTARSSIGEPVERVGHEADAQVTALQQYIENVCLK